MSAVFGVCNPVGVAFGDAVRPADNATAADWIAPLLGPFGTVGGLVPGGFEQYLLVDYRGIQDEHGPAEDRVVEDLASALDRGTSSPEKCSFAIWEGYGFTSTSGLYGRQGLGRRERTRLRDELRRRDEQWNLAAGIALSSVPIFELPNRRYYLVVGPVEAAAHITRSGGRFAQPPDLWWPRDRSWFVGSDTDLDWTYVAGSRDLIEELRAPLRWPTRTVDWHATNAEVSASPPGPAS